MSDSTSTPFFSPSFPAFKTLITFLRPSFWLGGNWKKAIKESGLPTDVQATIHQVVQRSRLMRREKFDVAEELIQHFQDGNQQGRSFEALTETFGDPESAALLIRRSKIRNRSVWISAARMIPPMMLCFSIVYLGLFLWYHSGKASPTIDYMAELNRNSNEAEEEEKAWPLYRTVWAKYQLGGMGEYADMRQQMFVEDKGTAGSRLVRPSDQQWPQAVEVLKQHQELLGVFRKGANRKSFGLVLTSDVRQYSDEDFAALFPYSKKETHEYGCGPEDPSGILDGATIGVLLPHVSEVRNVARLFHVDTRHAVVEGDSERATTNIETVLGLANQITDNKILVSSLVAVAISSIGFDQLEDVIRSNPDFLSPAQLDRLQSKIKQLDIHSWLDYSGEKACFKDMVQRCYTDDGNGDGRLTAVGMRLLKSDFLTGVTGLSNPSVPYSPPAISFSEVFAGIESALMNSEIIAPTSVLMCAGRKETLAKAEEFFSEVESDSKLPFWESRNSKTDGWQHHDDFFSENQAKFILLSKMFPAVSAVNVAIARAKARQDAVIVALAMHRYHRQHNQWPETTEELVGNYLKEVPVDIINGKPLHFKVVDDAPLIYSVGMDHDDDGGVDAKRKGKPAKRSSIVPGPKDDDFEGDWILWSQAMPLNSSK